MALYRILLTIAAPILIALAVLRVLRGIERRGDLAQRLGAGGGTPGAIWLHGASNGELTSARTLIDGLLDAFPATPLVITANTASGRALVAGWTLPRVTARLAPLDLRWTLARFRAAWRPAALIVLENELWPNRIATASGPVLCVGARMSARSFARWRRVPGLARRVLGRIAWLIPQDDASGAHFRALGVPADRIGPTATLKSAVTLDPFPAGALTALAAVFSRADTLLAASTHAGEEAAILQGFAAARQSRPGLKLILAPRHPRRGDEIAALIAATGLPWARRSTGRSPTGQTAIYLADTLGEMALWYALAGITFVGGSLVPRGGHTPFEPCRAGSAILHGPSATNFAAAYAALDADGGAWAVTDAAGLADALIRLAPATAQAGQARRASAILKAIGTGPDPVRQIIDRLHPAIAG